MKVFPLPNKQVHQQVDLLLPWYINGTLSEAERKTVKIHLQNCALCRKTLSRLSRLAQTIEQAPDMGVSTEAAMDKFWQQVEAKGNHQANEPDKVRFRLPSLDRFFSSPLTAAMTVVVLLIPMLVLLAGQLWLGRMLDTEYRTLSMSPQSRFQKNDIRIILSTEIDRRRLKKLLQPLVEGVDIVHGGSMEGHSSYVVRCVSSVNMQQTLKRLRAMPQVIFAEPALPATDGESSPGGQT